MNIARTTALVTGSNRGLGRHLANELINRGATVYAAARNPDAVDLPGVKAVALDITDRASVASATKIASDVTLLIQQRRLIHRPALFDGDESQIRFEMDTHVFGTLSVIRGLRPEDLEQRRRVDTQHPFRTLVGQLSEERCLLRGEVGGMVDGRTRCACSWLSRTSGWLGSMSDTWIRT